MVDLSAWETVVSVKSSATPASSSSCVRPSSAGGISSIAPTKDETRYANWQQVRLSPTLCHISLSAAGVDARAIAMSTDAGVRWLVLPSAMAAKRASARASLKRRLRRVVVSTTTFQYSPTHSTNRSGHTLSNLLLIATNAALNKAPFTAIIRKRMPYPV